MAASKPDYLDLEGLSSYERPNAPFAVMSSHSDGSTSPRISDVPPAMSPLDALAYQGRLLARRFEEENKKGSRLSRLPPTTIKQEFALARPGYFRSLSANPQTSFGSGSSDGEDITPRTLREVKQDPETRPQSHYPVLQSDEFGLAGAGPRQMPFRNQLARVDEPIAESPEQEQRDYFNIPRSHSPEQIEASLNRVEPFASKSRSNTVQSTQSAHSVESTGSGYLAPRTPHNLAPPKAPTPLRGLETSPSIRAVIADASEDGNSSVLSGSIDSLSPYKPPFTTISRSQSPASPFATSIPRSPSIASEQSYNSQGLPRPSFNFSRPLSRSGQSFEFPRASPNPLRQDSVQSSSTRPSFDLPQRQDSADTPGTPFTDAPQTPVSLPGDDLFLAQQSDPNGNQFSSYTYAKYALPRGKTLKRESINPQEFIDRQFEWNGLLSNDDTVRSTSLDLIPSPPPSSHGASTIRPMTGSDTTEKARSSFSISRKTPPKKVKRPKSAHNNRSMSPSPDPTRRPKSSHQQPLSPAPSTIDTSRSQTSTIKARMDRDRTKPPSAEITREGHLEKGIECHEAGRLQESTYHLRLAAKAGHPTGMLLYALACRHGWGMRPSPAEGVAWLQKAVDSAQLEVAEDEDLTKKGRPGDILERKSHKAQFALSVYELGVSYMNGWGVKVDKALAVRCFEIAGNWGDADALAEAGFCYTEGVGVRKDLKKAANFYRKAEAKGMSMTGNSWIYKDKYMEDSEERLGRSATKASKSSTEKKSRNKSRTRGIFSRKKSFAE